MVLHYNESSIYCTCHSSTTAVRYVIYCYYSNYYFNTILKEKYCTFKTHLLSLLWQILYNTDIMSTYFKQHVQLFTRGCKLIFIPIKKQKTSFSFIGIGKVGAPIGWAQIHSYSLIISAANNKKNMNHNLY